jgi:hypothetical protein
VLGVNGRASREGLSLRVLGPDGEGENEDQNAVSEGKEAHPGENTRLEIRIILADSSSWLVKVRRPDQPPEGEGPHGKAARIREKCDSAR